MRCFALIILLLAFACQRSDKPTVIDEAYLSDFERYQKTRQAERNGYLKLCGLHPLGSLATAFGTDSLNDIVLDIPELPPQIGFYSVSDEGVQFVAAQGVQVMDEGGQVVEKKQMDLDERGNSEKLYLDRLSWMIITRGGAPYLRLWDSQHPAVAAFQPFDRYQLTPDFIFEATFQYFETPKLQQVMTQLGSPETTKFVGQLSFDYQGNTYTLEVGEGGFTMVADATSGITTYGGGRYLDLVLPDQDGKVTLDFNLLYNPPCTFSDFTTCQYPPSQNVLPFAVEAGERS